MKRKLSLILAVLLFVTLIPHPVAAAEACSEKHGWSFIQLINVVRDEEINRCDLYLLDYKHNASKNLLTSVSVTDLVQATLLDGDIQRLFVRSDNTAMDTMLSDAYTYLIYYHDGLPYYANVYRQGAGRHSSMVPVVRLWMMDAEILQSQATSSTEPQYGPDTSLDIDYDTLYDRFSSEYASAVSALEQQGVRISDILHLAEEDCPDCEEDNGSTESNASDSGGSSQSSSSSGPERVTCEKCYGGSCSHCNGMGYKSCTRRSCIGGTCSFCNGTGTNSRTGKPCTVCSNGRCTTCGGDGRIECGFCNGSGDCTYCNGLGFVLKYN